MYVDNQLVFSNEQPLGAGGTGAIASTNIVDLTKPGDAEPRNYVLVVLAGAVPFASSGGTATLTISLKSGAQNPPTDEVLLTTSTFTITQLNTLGVGLVVANLPRPVLQFLEVVYTVAGEQFSAGTITAFITENAQTQFNHNPAL